MSSVELCRKTRDLSPLVCFSHLRWDHVRQRPQHLMDRFASKRPVIYFEEPLFTDHHLAYYEAHRYAGTQVRAVRPCLPRSLDAAGQLVALSGLLDEVLALHRRPPVLWFYTPAMLAIAEHVHAAAVVYDCMDELANFRYARGDLKELEARLLQRADVVFAGGRSLYEARASRHDDIHLFPSAVDAAHFNAARAALPEPSDQAQLPGPRLGYCGVIDERLDLELIAEVAAARPEYSFVFVGPLAKLEPTDLPSGDNLHYLGMKAYSELPAYLAGWDAALMPFALNEATRYISPTKTPEYLAAGLPVVSTPVPDVVSQYGAMCGVAISDRASTFTAACDAAIELRGQGDWLSEADEFLATVSWDATFERMLELVTAAARRVTASRTQGRSSRFEPAPRGVSRDGRQVAVRPPPLARQQAPAGQAIPAQLRAPAPAPLRARLSPTLRRPSSPRRPYDVVIAGAGFAGSVLAERLAAGAGLEVLVCDRRPHIGGNAYDEVDAAGILVHRYGPHIFHTNSQEVFDYLSRFTAWRGYEHRVLAAVAGKLVPMPINRTTLNALYGLNLASDSEAEAFLAARAQPLERIETSRDVVVAAVGEELYKAFFEGYTRKQWGLDPAELDRSVTSRVPTRTDTDDRYFQDRFQAMPAKGYTRLFENLLDHPRITLALGTDFVDARSEAVGAHVVFTGPIDAYFEQRYGPLPYRSLEFRFETHDLEQYQPVAVVNYPDEAVAHTRVTEYKHLTGQRHPRTTISYEYARGEGDPYYPVPRAENQELYRRYRALALATPGVTFVGRLGTYRYYNMDQVVAQALATYRKLRPALAARGRLEVGALRSA